MCRQIWSFQIMRRAKCSTIPPPCFLRPSRPARDGALLAMSQKLNGLYKLNRAIIGNVITVKKQSSVQLIADRKPYHPALIAARRHRQKGRQCFRTICTGKKI